MRLLRITLEETNENTRTCYRAERVITGTELKSYRHLKEILATTFVDLEKTLDQEIKQHEQANVSRPAVCTPPNPEAASGNNEAPGVGR